MKMTTDHLCSLLIMLGGALTLGPACGGTATSIEGGPGDGTGASREATGGALGMNGGTSTGGAGIGGASTGGTGGMAQTGDSGGTGGSGGEPTGVVEVPESPCSTPGALACAGNNQSVALVCSGGIWQVSQVCLATQACDSRPGPMQGTCRDLHPECTDRHPGEGYCLDETTRMACGPDNVTLEPEECTGSCFNDACDNRPNYCPVGDYIFNCGTECGVPMDGCFVPGMDCVSSIGVPFSPGQPWRLRTANYDGTCSACDPPMRRARIVASAGPVVRWKIAVPSPWKLAPANEVCPETAIESGCLIVEQDSGYLAIAYTDDPAASEVTIVVESEALEDEELECP